MQRPTDIYLGLGSNQGNREQLIREAIVLLSAALGAPLSQSTTIETEPWGFSSPNPFLNMVVHFSASISPYELLDTTEAIERQLGRLAKSTPSAGYSDRPIDIDILLFGTTIMEDERLTIPHPRMHERMFVLQPLAEITLLSAMGYFVMLYIGSVLTERNAAAKEASMTEASSAE